LKRILYTKFFNEEIKEKVDIILSPQFYWIKKIDIPIKSQREAKKIAQNYFDLKGNFLFDAVKIGDTFFAIALDKNLELNINKKYINSLRIAQVELYNFDEINIASNYQLKKIEDILFCFPINNSQAPNIDEILPNLKLSNYTINLYNAVEIDKTSISLMLFIFLILNISLDGLIYTYKKELSNIKAKKEQLSKYNLPLTNIQLDSILLDLKLTQKNNIKLKKDLKFFSRIPLNKGEKVILLEKKLNGYKIKISTKRDLLSYFQKRFKIKSSNLANSIYEVELING